MSIFTSVGVENLQLRNGSTGFNKLDRFFNTVAEADAAVAGGSYTPDPTVTNGVLIADVGFAIYNFDTNTFDAVAFNQLTAETVMAAKINESTAALAATIGQASDGLISEERTANCRRLCTEHPPGYPGSRRHYTNCTGC